MSSITITLSLDQMLAWPLSLVWLILAAAGLFAVLVILDIRRDRSLRAFEQREKFRQECANRRRSGSGGHLA